MSQKIFLCIIGVLIVLFTGCGRQQGQMSYIGAESAKKTALKAALLTEKEISFINADLDTRDGLDYYRVCFEAAGQSYQKIVRLVMQSWRNWRERQELQNHKGR